MDQKQGEEYVVLFKGGPDDGCILAGQDASDTVGMASQAFGLGRGAPLRHLPWVYRRSMAALPALADEIWKRSGWGVAKPHHYEVESIDKALGDDYTLVVFKHIGPA